jgi:hypothetical protein
LNLEENRTSEGQGQVEKMEQNECVSIL